MTATALRTPPDPPGPLVIDAATMPMDPRDEWLARILSAGDQLRRVHAIVKHLGDAAKPFANTLRDALIHVEASKEELQLIARNPNALIPNPNEEKKPMKTRSTATSAEEKKSDEKPQKARPKKEAAARKASPAGSTPRRLRIGKKSMEVSTWADVLRLSCELLLETEPVKFKKAFVDDEFKVTGQKWRRLSKSEADLHRPHPIGGGFVELKLSPEDKLKLARKLFTFCGLDAALLAVDC